MDDISTKKKYNTTQCFSNDHTAMLEYSPLYFRACIVHRHVKPFAYSVCRKKQRRSLMRSSVVYGIHKLSYLLAHEMYLAIHSVSRFFSRLLSSLAGLKFYVYGFAIVYLPLYITRRLYGWCSFVFYSNIFFQFIFLVEIFFKRVTFSHSVFRVRRVEMKILLLSLR